MTQPQRLITVIPPDNSGNGAVPANGTKILDSDGNAIDGVTKVELSAEVGGVWSAILHCYVRPARMDCVKLTEQYRSPRDLDRQTKRIHPVIEQLLQREMRDHRMDVNTYREAINSVEGVSQQPSQLDRIEAKLDALLLLRQTA